MTDNRFPSPFEVEAPEGIDGWEELYPYSVTFGEAPPGLRGQPFLVLGLDALGHGDDAVGLDVLRDSRSRRSAR